MKKLTIESNDIYVIKRNQIYITVKRIWDNSPDVLNLEQIEEIYQNLQLLTNPQDSVKQNHINNINEKYKNKNETLICPKCGGKLIIRTAKKGENAGNQFYGCSNFPKCRYTKEYETNK